MENRLLRQPVFFVGAAFASPWCPRGGGMRSIPEGIRTCEGRRHTTPQSRCASQLPFTGEPFGAVCRGRCPHRPVPRSGLAADGRLRDPPLQGAVQICRGRCPHRPDREAAKTAPSACTKLSTVSTELSTAFVEKSCEIPCNGSTVCDIIYIELFCLFPAIAMETP